MAKKKIKEEIKKPDIVMVTLERVARWVKTNPRTCIIAVIVAVVIGLSAWGYQIYEDRKDEKVQHMIADGINNFQQYTFAKKEDALGKAESAFRNVLNERSGGPGDVAKLYLARIAIIKGKGDEARALYEEILNNPSNDTVKKLSEKSLQELPKKQ